MQSTKHKVGEVYEQPLSPLSRVFHEPSINLHIVAIFGMKTLVNLEVFKADLVHVMDKNHRFSSLQVCKKNGSMIWVPMKVNMDNHVVVPELDPNMESADKFVEDYISNLSRSNLDNSKPLWDLHILNTKTSHAHSTCIFRFHHSLGDGMSLMNLLLVGSRKASDPKALPTLPGDKRSSRLTRVTNLRSIFMVIWNSIVGLVMLLLTALFLEDTKTPLKSSSPVGYRPRRIVHISVSLVDIKTVKKAMNVTVNDVIAGVIQAALHRYINRRYGGGENNNKVPKDVRLRANLVFNLRASTKVNVSGDTPSHGKWGNKVVFMLLPLDVRHKEDPLDYVREANTIMERKKASFEPFFTWFFTNLVMKLFGVKIAVKMIKTFVSRTTLWFSNVPGPQEEISLCRHEVAYLAPSVYGQSTALVIHVVSYVDKVIFVLSVDEEIIPDSQNLCEDLQQALHHIKTHVSAAECV
uniref:wax ester synthase/diacylglycerol acyltransferase 7-like n=1 Tax=Erigeron canadensis TaxID=72917 RepID=UPI001CB9014D|nr:wax ester synthase/diacylglycerol acyltransferase 7-like [Erigeron canadensis]